MMRLSFTTRLTIAIALGGICTVLLVILALCGGSSASAREAEARSAYTADAFELEYGAIYTGNPVDISAVNGDGKSDVLRAFVLVAKDTVHVTGLTVVTDRLTSAARLYLTANKEDEEEGEEGGGIDLPVSSVAADAGDTGFSAAISVVLPAGCWLIVTFSEELPVQAIFVNYSK